MHRDEGGERRKCHVRQLIFELGNDFQTDTRPPFSTAPLLAPFTQQMSSEARGRSCAETVSSPPLPPSPHTPFSPLSHSRHFRRDTAAWPGSQRALVVAPCQAESGLAGPSGSRPGASCPRRCPPAAHESPPPGVCRADCGKP